REKRTEDFLNELNKTIQATIQWKVRDKFQALIKENNITDTSLLQKTNNIGLQYTKEDLSAQLNTGARVTGNYVLKYTNDIAADIKQKFKTNVQPFLDAVYEVVNRQITNDVKGYQREKERIESILKQKRLQKALTLRYTKKQRLLQEALEWNE